MNKTTGWAVRRGTIGAVIGLAVMIILVMFSGGFSNPYAWMYVLAGPFYGFGLTFANWHEVMRKTKRGAIQGAAGLGIGWILSRWLKDSKWGLFGWLFFLIRVSWHLGFCWIPGIWYGIKAISDDLKTQAQPQAPVKPQTMAKPQAPGKSQAVSNAGRPGKNPEPKISPLNQDRIARAAAAMNASSGQNMARQNAGSGSVGSGGSPKSQAKPLLSCVAGVFSGANFPIRPGEEIVIGSDPSVCQIVLPADCAVPVHCSVLYDEAKQCWMARDLSGGQTLANGIAPIGNGVFGPVASGTVLCIGRGEKRQYFKVG